MANYEIESSQNLIQIRFPEVEEQCIASGSCSVEMIAAEKDASFFVFNYGTEKNVEIRPVCFNISHLDLNACSGNGFCVSNDLCECFLGYRGVQCQSQYNCSELNNCTENGYCVSKNKCLCSNHAKGVDCSIPVLIICFF